MASPVSLPHAPAPSGFWSWCASIGLLQIASDFRRDVTLREDACQVRKGEAPRVLAVLNSFLLAVLDLLGVSNVPQQMRFFDAHPLQAVRLLLGSLLTFTSPCGGVYPEQYIQDHDIYYGIESS